MKANQKPKPRPGNMQEEGFYLLRYFNVAAEGLNQLYERAESGSKYALSALRTESARLLDIGGRPEQRQELVKLPSGPGLKEESEVAYHNILILAADVLYEEASTGNKKAFAILQKTANELEACVWIFRKRTSAAPQKGGVPVDLPF